MPRKNLIQYEPDITIQTNNVFSRKNMLSVSEICWIMKK